MKVNVIKSVLKANDLVAEKNRDRLRAADTLAINLISAPGSGKTTLLEKTIPALRPEFHSMVVVGDLETTRDADRLSGHALEVTQINTGMSCHLYANQVASAIEQLPLEKADFLFIENVGNMVCPGEFDLGENLKVILYSIPEGDDKVAKYPTIFRVADLILLTKADLLPHLNFDMDRVREDINRLNAQVPVLEISTRDGQGLAAWLEWLREKRAEGIGLSARFIAE
ncbi:MAG: hydrogenase nickel incorporation protein HypB [Candidatus Omnitrophica bacterium]|nr:hydrogenase nickel incorporation protein HypB [Candidatus Omnitrophota bacterium]